MHSRFFALVQLVCSTSVAGGAPKQAILGHRSVTLLTVDGLTELMIQQIKDFRRCVDYLETRQDIDGKKFAFYGMSWGGGFGAIITAVEPRLKASVLAGASMSLTRRPEVSPINYVTRVKIPTLMLNGKFDMRRPEKTIQPMYDLLGTPAPDKQLRLYETDHLPPRNELIKETLAWLDRYLGPVQ